MKESFVDALAAGGKKNSLGRAEEVVGVVLDDKSRLSELYDCLFFDDAWVRMRAADALEKICRVHPDWLEPYVNRFESELSTSAQPSIQWHLAQMYAQISLTDSQKQFAINWLKNLLSTKDVDWIVSANAMTTLVQFAKEGSLSPSEVVALLKIQKNHKSNSVIRRADKLLAELDASVE